MRISECSENSFSMPSVSSLAKGNNHPTIYSHLLFDCAAVGTRGWASVTPSAVDFIAPTGGYILRLLRSRPADEDIQLIRSNTLLCSRPAD